MFDINADLIKQWIFTIVRYVTPWLAAWISTKTGVASAEVSTWIGTTLTILMGIWAMVNKVRYETKVNTALEMTKGSSKDNLKAVIAAGQGESATAKK